MFKVLGIYNFGLPAIGGGLFPHGFISYYIMPYYILPGAWLVSTNLAIEASLLKSVEDLNLLFYVSFNSMLFTGVPT